MAVSACSKPSDTARKLTIGWGRRECFVPEMMQKRTFSAKKLPKNLVKRNNSRTFAPANEQ